ncbi:DUF4396 domain-containing protein [Streptomyces kebangsaanensis]|uniref:DUF4396 domain-containing protein n=1 Tax=Streptomyces kebangsaanensis TaxID=864058 RepID=UPI000A6396E6|nr:DUF4396 domain-containing protein [Streptomyces kebangsaanensis]
MELRTRPAGWIEAIGRLSLGAAFASAGKALYADFVLDFVFARTLGVVFQYFTIVPTRDVGRMRGGSGSRSRPTPCRSSSSRQDSSSACGSTRGWSSRRGLPRTTAAYWTLMQVSMVLGFFTAWPVNAWLVRAGWKEKM